MERAAGAKPAKAKPKAKPATKATGRQSKSDSECEWKSTKQTALRRSASSGDCGFII